MSDNHKQRLGPVMQRALQAVARLKGDDTVVWVRLAERGRDNLRVWDDEVDSQQGSKPAER